MKTNQIMHRPFLGTTIRQMHKTGFFNATDITEIYNEIRVAEGKAPKQMNNYFQSIETQEFIQELCNELNSQAKSKHCFTKVSYNPSDLKQIKRGKENCGTWLHPSLFIDYAMWLNPKFRAKVVIWIADNLLFFRDNGGDAFNELNAALKEKFNLSKIDHGVYVRVAKQIAYKVFGTRDAGQWNYGSQEKQYQRERLQRRVINALEFGKFESVQEIIDII